MTKLLKLPKSKSFRKTAAASIDASAVRMLQLMVTVGLRNDGICVNQTIKIYLYPNLLH